MVGIGAHPLQNSLNNLSSSISSINGQISTINSDITTIETNLSTAGSHISNLYSAKADKYYDYKVINSIPDYADANNYHTIGSYTCSSNASMATCSNFPSSTAGTLYVINCLGERSSIIGTTGYWEYFVQIFMNLSGSIWTRPIANNNGNMSYGSWTSLI